MLKKLRVTVNGVAYDVTVEEESPAEPVQTQTPEPVKTPEPEKTPEPPQVKEPAAPPPKHAPAVLPTDHRVESPLPGTVLRFAASVGETVAKNQVLLVVEAMKMENEIVSPADGTLVFAAAKGTTVHMGDLLAAIRG